MFRGRSVEVGLKLQGFWCPGAPRSYAAAFAARARADDDAMGDAATTEVWRRAGDQHPQYVVPALARLAEAGKPVPVPCK